MSKTLKRTLFWTPRILGILFILFVNLFALEHLCVVGEHSGLDRVIVFDLVGLQEANSD